jgi:hypothetical protein
MPTSTRSAEIDAVRYYDVRCHTPACGGGTGRGTSNEPIMAAPNRKDVGVEDHAHSRRDDDEQRNDRFDAPRRPKRVARRLAAKQRDELAASRLTELHSLARVTA